MVPDRDQTVASELRDRIAAHIRARGPITVAEFMAFCLYHPTLGYYTRAPRRSGRAGDFVTSVDVSPLFGELLAVQLAEMWRLMGEPPAFDLVEAGAGDGRLARGVLEAASAADAAFYAAIRLHLVEVSAAARAAHPATLGPHRHRLVSSAPALPPAVAGVILANELLDALPVHLVVMRETGLREVFVTERAGQLVPIEGPPSTPALAAALARAGAALEPGWRAEVRLAADAWVADAAGALTRGFLVLIDYGYEAAELYSAAHATGTLRSARRHALDPTPGDWLLDPGARDLTAHVDLTSVRLAAERAGLTTLAALDQTYFLLGLGLADRLATTAGDAVRGLARRLAAKALVVPGGLGSTHKVLVFGRNVGTPALACTRFRARLT
jgi:SAM-dependent MidA family methyltransferase